MLTLDSFTVSYLLKLVTLAYSYLIKQNKVK